MADEHGHVKISRKAYAEDPFWNEDREFSRWEAWEDLIQTAAWKRHRRMVDGTLVSIGRGQLLASERFLATRWGWSRSKVHRFLALLVDMERINVDVDHDANHVGAMITLCNYDTYQSRRTSGRTSDEPSANQPRTSREPAANQREGSKSKRRQGKQEEHTPSKPDAPIAEMHRIFLDALGGDGPQPRLTDKRRQKYAAVWTEHLKDADDWPRLWTALLYAITESDHHMSERRYQMPESFLRNPERRDSWVLKAHELLNGNGRPSKGNRKLARHMNRLAGLDLDGAMR